MVRQNAEARADRQIRHRRTAVWTRGYQPMLLAGRRQDEIGDDAPIRVANEPVTPVHCLIRGSTVAGHSHPARVNSDAAVGALMADDGGQHGEGDVAD